MPAQHAIPRLRKIGYLEVALTETAKGSTFERIRQALVKYAALQKGEDEMIGARIRDAYTLWSPTQEAIAELMRLGYMEPAALPSERKYVDAYRSSTFRLSEVGATVAEQLAQADPNARATFLDALSVALAEAHAGFANLLAVVGAHPLCIPEYTIERISTITEGADGSTRVAEDAISRIVAHWPESLAKPAVEELAASINAALSRRFSTGRASRPSQKDMLDTIGDAILGFTVRARQIPLDAVSFDIAMAWAGQLALLEESRYVEGWPGRTVWATAHVGQHAVSRRGFRQSGSEVVAALETAFRQVAEALPEGKASGFLPIHRVRAGAAFSARVNLRLVNMVIAQLLAGHREAPYSVQVGRGGGIRPPPSEPIFTDRGERFFELMIIRKENCHVEERSV